MGQFEERRAELAEATLQTLAELGYARTSLREIANHSDFSHGVLHYYFQDKFELIIYGVRRYKAACVTRFDDVVTTASGAEELARQFARRLADTGVADAGVHRLWYDLRAQSWFEPRIREDVLSIDETLAAMIWRVVERYAVLAGRPPVVPRTTAYALLDGLFQHMLIDHAGGDEAAPARLVREVEQLLPTLTGLPMLN